MANAPQFTATPVLGAASVSATADTSYIAPTHIVTIFTAGTNGTKVDEIDVIGTGTTVAGVINIFAYDSTTYHLVDSFTIPIVTVSATSGPGTWKHTFANLVLPSSSWSLVATSTVSTQLANVNAFGGSF